MCVICIYYNIIYVYVYVYVYIIYAYVIYVYIMIPGAKGLNLCELARRWVKDLEICPDMSIEFGVFDPDIIIISIKKKGQSE